MPDQNMKEFLSLDTLRRELNYLEWDSLNLKNLDPLRIEVRMRMDKLIERRTNADLESSRHE